MKTIAQLQAAVDAVREVCRQHGVVLIGTCWREGIAGEILVEEASEQAIQWEHPRRLLTNRVTFNDYAGEHSVEGIGDIP
jgi:hypothetical protein